MAFTRKILYQIFVTYICWTKIIKPESRFSVQIYFIYLFTVSKNTDEVIANMARYLFGQISSELLFDHPQLQVLYTRHDQGNLQLRHLSHPATRENPKHYTFLLYVTLETRLDRVQRLRQQMANKNTTRSCANIHMTRHLYNYKKRKSNTWDYYEN